MQALRTRDPNAGALVFDHVRCDSESFSDPGLDNVTLTAVASVPEPSGWAMMLVGFGPMAATRYRRRPTRAVYA